MVLVLEIKVSHREICSMVRCGVKGIEIWCSFRLFLGIEVWWDGRVSEMEFKRIGFNVAARLSFVSVFCLRPVVQPK